MQELDSSADFDATRDREFFAALPARPAVFAIDPRAELTGAQPYLLRTANLRQRLARLLSPPEPASKRLNLREFAARVRYRIAGSPFELSFLHWQHARALWPAAYRERLRLRAPAGLRAKRSLASAPPLSTAVSKKRAKLCEACLNSLGNSMTLMRSFSSEPRRKIRLPCFWCAPAGSRSRGCCASPNSPVSLVRSSKSCASGWSRRKPRALLPGSRLLHSKASVSWKMR